MIGAVAAAEKRLSSQRRSDSYSALPPARVLCGNVRCVTCLCLWSQDDGRQEKSLDMAGQLGWCEWLPPGGGHLVRQASGVGLPVGLS